MHWTVLFHNLCPHSFNFFFISDVALVEAYILAFFFSLNTHDLFHFGNHGGGQIHSNVDYDEVYSANFVSLCKLSSEVFPKSLDASSDKYISALLL